ncbi:MAG TPA: membrane protein insertion efficiency factor YidD [Vicinamibacterales bacterium]|nr:membrane protein insertion efficiency factor YidD [Vicinamibacterales bacterium]
MRPLPSLKGITSLRSPEADVWPRPGPAATVVLAALSIYKLFISQLFAGSCRFHPSCSQYMTEAVRRFGATRGVWLGLRRLARCHPFGGHGVDHVPFA